jgi:hypothetical protein
VAVKVTSAPTAGLFCGDAVRTVVLAVVPAAVTVSVTALDVLPAYVVSPP